MTSDSQLGFFIFLFYFFDELLECYVIDTDNLFVYI